MTVHIRGGGASAEGVLMLRVTSDDTLYNQALIPGHLYSAV